MKPPLSNSSAPRVRKPREKLRLSGMRSIQLWVPDTRTKAFKLESCRQAQNVATNSIHENQEMDWIESHADSTGWEA